MDQLCIVTTGGTIDKIYFDDKSDFQIGEPQIGRILDELGVAFRYSVIPILRKDSLHITDGDRELVRATIESVPWVTSTWRASCAWIVARTSSRSASVICSESLRRIGITL